jgi:hypothetical protein
VYKLRKKKKEKKSNKDVTNKYLLALILKLLINKMLNRIVLEKSIIIIIIRYCYEWFNNDNDKFKMIFFICISKVLWIKVMVNWAKIDK